MREHFWSGVTLEPWKSGKGVYILHDGKPIAAYAAPHIDSLMDYAKEKITEYRKENSL